MWFAVGYTWWCTASLYPSKRDIMWAICKVFYRRPTVLKPWICARNEFYSTTIWKGVASCFFLQIDSRAVHCRNDVEQAMRWWGVQDLSARNEFLAWKRCYEPIKCTSKALSERTRRCKRSQRATNFLKKRNSDFPSTVSQEIYTYFITCICY